ncbi:ANL family adenylate-forming protein [Cloacibacterium sp.]|uniref:ANL family adenylate-forming protein n=1 Tax=Cloacibacterium sp. TaxID=1913682 RepID=UPI0039E60643
MIFLANQSSEITYNQLIEDLNCKNEYSDHFFYKELYSFYLNLLYAIIQNRNLVLVDADWSLEEIYNYNVSPNENISVENSIKIKDVKKLSEAISNSNSKITLFTSGTTGQPKKITHSLQNLLRNIKINENQSNLVWGFAYNPTHMAGLQVFLQAIVNGNSLVNIFNSSRTEIYEKIKKYNITNISATPTFYRLLLPIEETYPFVKRITLGGEKSDKKLLNNIQKLFPEAKINNVYASTEAGAIFSAFGEFFKIKSYLENLIKVEENELYLHKSLLGKSEELDNIKDFYATGDLIEWIDEENKIFKFISRKNELINVGGYKVNPNEVEEILLQNTKIKNIKVFGKPNAVLGNILSAEIVLFENQEMEESEIRNYLDEKLQNYKIPRRISFVEEIGLTRTGKKLKQ